MTYVTVDQRKGFDHYFQRKSCHLDAALSYTIYRLDLNLSQIKTKKCLP